MIFAAKAHRLVWLAPVHLSLAILGAFGSSFSLLLPSVTGLSGMPFGVIVALVDCILFSFVINEAWPDRRTVPVRSSAGIATAIVGSLVFPVLVVLGALAALGIGNGASYLGVFCWLLGMQLLVGVLITSKYQAMGPAVYILFCALFGRWGFQVQPWAWPLAQVPEWAAFAIGTASLLVGLTLLLGLRLRVPKT